MSAIANGGTLFGAEPKVESVVNKNNVAYIDTSRRLYYSAIDSVGSYTALEDCWITIYFFKTKEENRGASVYIDSDVVCTTSSTVSTSCPMFPLKKGQVFSWSEYVLGSVLVYPMILVGNDVIGGGGNDSSNAVDSYYDNSTSGLTATNVQGAIDEVVNDINTTTDSINGLTNTIADIEAKAQEATNIAKGRNQAHVFATTSDMEEFLSNVDNAGLYNIGDNLYIVEVDVPDWWISEVLTEPDEDTGFYYKIGQLETQKVDLTNYLAQSDVVDDLTSTDTDKPLSANQGRVLGEEINKLSEITDVSELVTVRDSATTTLITKKIKKYGNRIKGEIAFRYNGDSLRNVLLFDVDESLSPVNTSAMTGFNQTSGNIYGFEISEEISGVKNVIRSLTLLANNNYVSDEAVYVLLDWYTT